MFTEGDYCRGEEKGKGSRTGKKRTHTGFLWGQQVGIKRKESDRRNLIFWRKLAWGKTNPWTPGINTNFSTKKKKVCRNSFGEVGGGLPPLQKRIHRGKGRHF